MSQEKSSRRSQRTVPRHMGLALLGGSLLVFLAGSTCLCWAIGDARLAQVVPSVEASTPAEQENPIRLANPTGRAETDAGAAAEQGDPGPGDTVDQPAQGDGTAQGSPPADAEQAGSAARGRSADDVEQPVPGTLASTSELIESDASGDESGESTGETKPPDPESGKRAREEKTGAGEKRQKAKAAARTRARSETRARAREKARAETRSQKKPQETTQGTTTTGPAAQSKPKSPTRKKRPVTRTVSRRVAVHRNVEHKAVEITERQGTETTVRRGACPVCGKAHAHDFTERVFDHYETVRVPVS